MNPPPGGPGNIADWGGGSPPDPENDHLPQDAAAGPHPPEAQGSGWREKLWDKVERRGWYWMWREAYDKAREPRYTDPEEKYWGYTSKPPLVTAVCSLLAVALFALAWWWPELRAAYPQPLPVGDGWLRYGLMVAGAFLAFLAWPYYRPKDWTPRDERNRTQAHMGFQDKVKRE